MIALMIILMTVLITSLPPSCTDDHPRYVEIQAKIKAAPYCYRSYNPASIKLYAERYAWWVESLEYVVLNKRTAITRPLARRIMRGCTKGSNPTDLAEELLELKAETFNSLEAQVYGMHLFAKERQAGRQHTLGGWVLLSNFRVQASASARLGTN